MLQRHQPRETGFLPPPTKHFLHGAGRPAKNGAVVLRRWFDLVMENNGSARLSGAKFRNGAENFSGSGIIDVRFDAGWASSLPGIEIASFAEPERIFERNAGVNF